MKKAIVLLLALTVIGGAVFAQATVNGYVRAKTEYTDAGFTYVDRLRLNFSAMTEDKNAAFYGRLQGSSGATDLIYYAYGAVKLADGMVKVSGGYVNNYDYTIGSSGDDWYMGGVSNNGYSYEHAKMLLTQLYPVEGLNLGVAGKDVLLEHGLGELSEREREVLAGRYGLRDREPETLEVLAERLGLTRERIRQIQQEALLKLKRRMLRNGIDRDSVF